MQLSLLLNNSLCSLQPMRSGPPILQYPPPPPLAPLSPAGSTPNLVAAVTSTSCTSPAHWASTNTLATPVDYRAGYNTISHSGSHRQPPTLSYLVAYTPEQIHELMKAQGSDVHEMQRRMLELSLKQQKHQSEEDAKWLEENLNQHRVRVAGRMQSLCTNRNCNVSLES